MVTILMLASLCLPAWAGAATYTVDQNHTNVAFQVRHLFTKVKGRFDKFNGKIIFDPSAPGKVKVEGTIDAASINTNVAKRDDHLRSKDFFNVEKFPQITFVSNGATDIDRSANTGKLEGQLTIHGITKPVVLDVVFLGAGEDPWGNKRAGFSARMTISRKEFGLTWNETLEAGGVLVGDEVVIELEVEGLLAE